MEPVTNTSTGTRLTAGREIAVIALDTPTLGDRSYLVHDGVVAFAVDPQRDIDRVLAILEREQVRLDNVFETHVHNDYVTGGYALARRTEAAYHLNADDPVRFGHEPVRDGDTITIGRMRLTAIATPGHTFTHLSYALTDDTGASIAVFSGGSLLYGSTGRPDLLGKTHTGSLVRHQHASVHRLATLPDETRLLPTHGFGSFCSSTQTDASSSTIGAEKLGNPALTTDVDTYVERLLGGLTAYPAYYAQMAPLNSAGPAEPDLSPPSPADPAGLRRRIEAGEWVVDLRNRTAFATGHLPGTLNFGLDGSFATYVGWLITWGTPLTLLASTAGQIAEAQRELVRIGIDRPAAGATGAPSDWTDGELASFATGSFADLHQVLSHRRVVVLDVRRRDEHATAHVRDALNIPIHELSERLHEVPAAEIWVHCATGYRSSVAASILDAAGRTVVAVDDDFDAAVRRGLPVTSTESPPR